MTRIPREDPKPELRRSLIAQRRTLDPAQKAAWDEAIGASLLAWWRKTRPESIGVYWPLRGEPELHTAYRSLQAEGATLALPVVIERDAPLAFAAWDTEEAMVKDAMGVAVPEHQRLLKPRAIVVPCLGYNAAGFRLGYGGGYYDRTLEAHPRPLTVGVAYAFSACEFPCAAHDVALDVILTELT